MKKKKKAIIMALWFFVFTIIAFLTMNKYGHSIQWGSEFQGGHILYVNTLLSTKKIQKLLWGKVESIEEYAGTNKNFKIICTQRQYANMQNYSLDPSKIMVFFNDFRRFFMETFFWKTYNGNNKLKKPHDFIILEAIAIDAELPKDFFWNFFILVLVLIFIVFLYLFFSYYLSVSILFFFNNMVFLLTNIVFYYVPFGLSLNFNSIIIFFPTFIFFNYFLINKWDYYCQKKHKNSFNYGYLYKIYCQDFPWYFFFINIFFIINIIYFSMFFNYNIQMFYMLIKLMFFLNVSVLIAIISCPIIIKKMRLR